MKEISVIKYQCGFCEKIFDRQWECELHEKEEHLCPECKHSYYVYGCERNCTLENEGKKCKFEEEEKGD